MAAERETREADGAARAHGWRGARDEHVRASFGAGGAVADPRGRGRACQRRVGRPQEQEGSIVTEMTDRQAEAWFRRGSIFGVEFFPACIVWEDNPGDKLTLWDGGREHDREWELTAAGPQPASARNHSRSDLLP